VAVLGSRRPQHRVVFDPHIVVKGRVDNRDVARHEDDLKTELLLIQ